MTSRTRFPVRLLAALVALAALALGPGCRDDITAPTMGRIAVEVSGAGGVEVFLDGELVGVDVDGLIGPLDPGTYTVSAVRECFETLPAREIQVDVAAGGIATASFRLEAREFGSAAVAAVDELTGGPVAGAEVWVETAPGTFSPTGLTTPATIASLPCGPTRLVLKRAGFEDTAPVEVRIDTGAETPVEIEMGPARAVLAEMTTYVVCPNCPPSTDRLEELQTQHPDRFYFIEWHTRPNLPLYDARWLDRERYYTGGANLGWPILVVQGDAAALLVGSQAATLEEYDAQVDAALAACGLDCPVALRTEGTVGSGNIDITALVKWRDSSLPGNLVLRFVLLEEDVDAPGNDSPYHAVPRDLAEVPYTPSSGVQSIGVSFPRDPSWGDHLGWVVLLQSDDTREVLAVHGRQEP